MQQAAAAPKSTFNVHPIGQTDIFGQPHRNLAEYSLKRSWISEPIARPQVFQRLYRTRNILYHARPVVLSFERFYETRKKRTVAYNSIFRSDSAIVSGFDGSNVSLSQRRNGQFLPSEDTANLLSELVRRAAVDASQFSNDLAPEAASNRMTIADMRDQLVYAMGSAVTLFTSVSRSFGNSSVLLTEGDVFRPVFADYFLSELPTVPIVDARDLLSKVLFDLRASLRYGSVIAGQSKIVFSDGRIVASTSSPTRSKGLDSLDELESVTFG
jgi:hypothetical protein